MSDFDEIIARYQEPFDKLNAHIYNHTANEDARLVAWWMHLQESGDIERVIAPDSQRLPDFFTLFKHPTALLYAISNKTLDFAAWFVPFSSTMQYRTAIGSLWTHANIRGKRRAYQLTYLVYSLAFEFYSAIFGMTWQPALLDIHQKLGYNVVGCVPRLYDKEHVYFVHLTRENFYNSRFAKIGGK